MMHIMHHSVHPPLSVGGGGGGWASDQIFKKAELDRISVFRGELLGKRGEGDFFQEGGGCSFYIKYELKSEIFNDKKSLWTEMFFSVITKNLNWEILTKNMG